MKADVYFLSTSTISSVSRTISPIMTTLRNFSNAYSIKQMTPGYVSCMATEIIDAPAIENVSIIYLNLLFSDTGPEEYV